MGRRGASQRDLEYIQQNNSRKTPKFQERAAHSGTGNLQNTNRLDQNRSSLLHIIKTSTENKERIPKAVREKKTK
jgi:hypothetical protein